MTASIYDFVPHSILVTERAVCLFGLLISHNLYRLVELLCHMANKNVYCLLYRPLLFLGAFEAEPRTLQYHHKARLGLTSSSYPSLS